MQYEYSTTEMKMYYEIDGNGDGKNSYRFVKNITTQMIVNVLT